MQEWTEALALYHQIHKKLKEVGFEQPFDFTMENPTLLSHQVAEYLNKPETKNLLHVGDIPFKNHDMVYFYLKEDILQSVKLKVEELVSHYKMLFYCGQFDILVTPAKTNKFVRKLRWSDASVFAKTRLINWYVDETIVGYVTSVSNLTDVLVINANHMAANSKPHFVYHLLRLFEKGGPFSETTLKMNTKI